VSAHNVNSIGNPHCFNHIWDIGMLRYAGRALKYKHWFFCWSAVHYKSM